MVLKNARYIFSVMLLASSIGYCLDLGSPEIMPFFSMKQLEGKQNIVPLLVIGSGPAGHMAATYGARGGIQTYEIKGQPGGLLAQTTEVENWPGETLITGPEIMDKLKSQSLYQGVKPLVGFVQKIDTSSWPYTVFVEGDKKLNVLSIVIATGATPKRLGIPGEDKYWGMGVTACAICDAPFYRDEEVVVIGGGDSAVEEAIQLTPYAKKVTILVRKGVMRAAAKMQERLKNYPKISVKYNVEPREIFGTSEQVTGVKLYNTETKKIEDFATAGVFLAIGHTPTTDFVKDAVQLDSNGYIVVKHPYQETSVKGIFAAGDVADHIYRQAGSSAGDGIKAGLDAVRFLGDIGYTNQVADKIASQLYEPPVRSVLKNSIEAIEDEDAFDDLRARAGNRLMVLDFWLDNCPGCKQLEPVLQEAASELKDKVLFASLHADEVAEVADKFDIQRAPTLILFKDGKVVERHTGFLPKSELDLFIKKGL